MMKSKVSVVLTTFLLLTSPLLFASPPPGVNLVRLSKTVDLGIVYITASGGNAGDRIELGPWNDPHVYWWERPKGVYSIYELVDSQRNGTGLCMDGGVGSVDLVFQEITIEVCNEVLQRQHWLKSPDSRNNEVWPSYRFQKRDGPGYFIDGALYRDYMRGNTRITFYGWDSEDYQSWFVDVEPVQ